MADGRQVPLPPGGGSRSGTVLIDGHFEATWRIHLEDGAASLIVEPFARMLKEAGSELEEEGDRLLSFAAADATVHDVRILRPGAR